jgi:hypothetical protein
MIGRQLVIASDLYTQCDVLGKMPVDLTQDYCGSTADNTYSQIENEKATCEPERA